MPLTHAMNGDANTSQPAAESNVGRLKQTRPAVTGPPARAPLTAPSAAPWHGSCSHRSSSGGLGVAATAAAMSGAPSVMPSPLLRDPEFVMYSYKILDTSHDWAACPCAHKSERACRRDPRRFVYSPLPCPDMRRPGMCPRDVSCPLSHSTTESWLHPLRYRTMKCHLGADCRRSLCFFAHDEEELRRPDAHEWAGSGHGQGQGHGHGPAGPSVQLAGRAAVDGATMPPGENLACYLADVQLQQMR
jgi:hypothetical protein